jgi:hypothetical protein
MWVAAGLLVALAVAAGVAAFLLHRAEPFLRARIVAELQSCFHARVELDSFHMSLVDGLRAEGKGLRIWPPAPVAGAAALETAGPAEPLIRLEEFYFRAPLRFAPGKPFHISVVELKGLDIHLPPRSHFEHGAVASADAGHTKGNPFGSGAGLLQFMVDSMECSGARLVLETNKPGKLPLEFAIAHFKLTNIASRSAIQSGSEDLPRTPTMDFDAELTNPRPVGTIHSTGRFGPWLVEDPGESPIAGDYRFDHADLASFKGIAGILSSTGHYEGTLRNLVVDGQASVPDFCLSHFGSALALDTRFHARVDGTNGDTWLEPVDATLGHSHFTAQGQIVRLAASAPGAPPHSGGHDIALTVNVDRARIEDFLQLASPPRRAAPLLTGTVTMKTMLHIPPGPAPVHERLRLNGRFELDQAQFSSTKIQDKIQQLSLRGQGRPKDLKTADSADIHSSMQGDFQLANGVVTLPNLVYNVPGARIELSGTYGLDGGALDFKGAAKMQATVSQMVGGFVGVLLKPADRYFKKDGAGTDLPIHIGGTREDPSFGIDFNRMKGSSPAPPGASR